MTDIQRLVDAVQAARADIAPTYHEYVQLAFALATDQGEAGRSAFHDLCRFSSKYDAKNADKVYSSALSSNRGEVEIATAFYLAKQAGVVVSYEGRETRDEGAEKIAEIAKIAVVPPASHTRTHVLVGGKDKVQGTKKKEEQVVEELLPGSEPLQPLPCFPTAQWPEPLNTIVNQGDTAPQRNVLFLTAITVMGTSMGKQVRFAYGEGEFSPCLQTFVVAPPASGKGVISHTRLLVMPMHDEMRRRYEHEMKEYKQKKAEYDAAGKERAKMEAPQPPRNRMFLISGNNTGTGILQNIMDNDGEGLIFEPEADTLSNAIRSEYGNFSDTLRKSYDHEMLSYNRRTDHEYREVSDSYLGVLLSGTPAQVKPLIPSAENGLFSRMLYYFMPGIHRWRDQFHRGKRDPKGLFRTMGREWKKRLDELKAMGLLTLRLTPEQEETFNAAYDSLLQRAELVNGEEMSSYVLRLAVNLLRILSVVAVLRGDFTPDKEIPSDNLKDGIIQRWDVHVRPEDFEGVMALLEPLYRHALHILSFLPPTEVSRRTNSERDSFFAALPNPFTCQMVKDLAKERGLKESTTLSWMYRLEDKGVLKPTGNIGEYIRARTHV